MLKTGTTKQPGCVSVSPIETVRLDLIKHITNANPNAIARLASLVLTSEQIAVDGSNVYQNGIKRLAYLCDN